MRLLFVLVFALVHASPAGATDHVPKVLRHKHISSAMSWIDLSAALDDGGRLRPEVAASRPALVRNLQANAAGVCRQFMVEPALEVFEASESLDDLTTAPFVILGTVVSVSEGFSNGFPGTLIGFRVTDAFRPRSTETRAPKLDVGSVRYTFIGSARIVTPDGAICSTAGESVPIPQRGDNVLMFSYFAPIDESDLIIPVESRRHLVVERGGERVFTPAALIDDLRGSTIAEAMTSLRGMTQRARARD